MQNETTRTLCPSCEYPAPAGKTYCSNRCAANADSLEKAVEYLGAVEVAPERFKRVLRTRAQATRFATNHWLDDVVRYPSMAKDIPLHLYLRENVAGFMRSHLVPEDHRCSLECCTADLTTGEEVPA